MELPETSKTYKLHSVPVRIRYTGPHELAHFEVITKDGEHTTYLRGRKLVGTTLPVGNAYVVSKQFDQLHNLGKCEETRWYEREGMQSQTGQRLKEMMDLADVIHGE
jgi:hypothetical protein